MTNPANKHATKEAVYFLLKRSLAHSLLYVGGHYPVLKGCFRNVLKERNDFRLWCTCHCYDYPQFVAVEIIHDTQSHPYPNCGCSSTISFDYAVRKVAFIGITSNMNSAIMVRLIKVEFVRKHHLLPICTPVSTFMSPLPPQASVVSHERNLV